MLERSSLPTETTTSEEVIRLDDLSKDYRMGDNVVHALRDLSFALTRGQYIAIMGHSGSGKSTLLNILGCLDQPSSGRYLVGGIDAARMSDSELSALRREKFGFVFQSFNLIRQLSVVENIELPLFYMGWTQRACRARSKELAEKVGLGNRLDHRPHELSGGQQQRVAIARALSNNPSVILADEPTGNLDSQTGNEIMAVLDDLAAAGRTVILVTHERDVAEHAHRIVHLKDGRIDREEDLLSGNTAA